MRRYKEDIEERDGNEDFFGTDAIDLGGIIDKDNVHFRIEKIDELV